MWMRDEKQCGQTYVVECPMRSKGIREGWVMFVIGRAMWLDVRRETPGGAAQGLHYRGVLTPVRAVVVCNLCCKSVWLSHTHTYTVRFCTHCMWAFYM